MPGAIINARIPVVVFGAYDPKAGSCGSVVNLFSLRYNHKPDMIGGFMQEEGAAELQRFSGICGKKEKKSKKKAGRFLSEAARFFHHF